MQVISSKTTIFGIARVGYVDDVYEVYVNTNDEGNIPHFHFTDAKEWDKFHTCICIDKAAYFHHTGKEDVLNSSLRKSLQKFMTSPVKLKKLKDKFTSNWELVCSMWDLNNSSMELDDIKQPDYRELPD